MTSLLEATKGSSGSSAPTSLHSFGIGRRWREAIAGDKGRTTGILVAVFAVASIIFMIMDGFKLYFQRLIDGLSNGFIYAAVALALVLIYKATGVINFAQGNMAMFGTFIAWVLAREKSWPVALAILVAMIVSAAIGAGFERVFVRPFDPASGASGVPNHVRAALDPAPPGNARAAPRNRPAGPGDAPAREAGLPPGNSPCPPEVPP